MASFLIQLDPGQCGGPEDGDEAVEFAMHTNTSGMYGPWIPLRLTGRWPNGLGFLGYSIGSERIRGYDVVIHTIPSSMVAQNVTICGEDLLPTNTSEIQFRWMNTVDWLGKNDIWAIFNVTVDLTTSDGDTVRIF